MPFSIGIPIGILMIFVGIVMYFIAKWKNKIWLGLIILGALTTLGTLAILALAVNSM